MTFLGINIIASGFFCTVGYWVFTVAVSLGAVALAECIAETVKLIRLDLRGNYIRTGGLMALMLALKVNQSVTRIDLDGEPKKEAVRSIVVSFLQTKI